MARPALALPSPENVRALLDTQRRLPVKVTPGAREEGLEIACGRLLAKVRAKPQEGAANAAVRDLIARALDLAPSRVEMLRGATSREKLFRIND